MEAISKGPKNKAFERLRDVFLDELKNPKERLRRRVSVQLWAEAERNPKILKIVRRSFEGPRKLLSGVLSDAQNCGEISNLIDADALARFGDCGFSWAGATGGMG
jgi:hypothetical protein